ncbi:ethanolamine ammonia-lyase small subunit [Bacillus sp. SORGH_AS 510]|uniref:ethanolamine ammonia-lyase subunit EutC n=1 Tax=Bacillus sp. SORGH_AS_0510 TaxID=3041771 RepID=UPI00278A9B77|nr:ethanolamine ammonia-lyase subunit EutC [Bacillus sp. SORGH_AS_0510]MDQ1145622.1 ethanolamine ammonia-lyase small subunit [Bacillus sp. SORGH_AS_0510]
MNPELVEQITKLIYEKLQSQTVVTDEQTSSEVEVKFWNHNADSQSHPSASNNCQPIKEKMHRTLQDEIEEINIESKPVIGIESPFDKDELASLISKTPARIGVGRAGLRPKTNTWLKFRYDHAAAVDAVYGDVNPGLLESLSLFKVNTKVADKEVYVRRPDFGRKLSEESKQLITQKCKKSPTVQIIVSDGLSSKAIDENLEDVFLSLNQALQGLGLDVGTPFFIEKGRVAAMDDVGELLKPKVIVYLIGERPGLVSAESLSAYLCYEPRLGTIEADRMVVSNIHKGGIPPVEAGAYLGTVIQKVLKYQASGVSLVQKEQ